MAESPLASFGDDVRSAAAPAEAPRDAIARRIAAIFGRRAAADRPEFDLAAPLKALFASSRETDSKDFSLGFSLRESAFAIERGKQALAGRARDLASAIEARRSGQLSLLVHSLRLVIALLWAIIAFRLDRAALSALANGQAMAGAMPVADALLLSRVFLLLAAAGIAAAFLGGWIVMAAGGGDNNRLRRKSSGFGAEAAEFAREFDADLDRSRERMDARIHGTGEAAGDLSRMHLTALEAAVFFHNIEFLTDSDKETARRKFRDYLRNHAAHGPAVSFLILLIPMLLGFIFGVGYGYVIFYPAPETTVTAVDSILKYPWAFLASAGLALVYAAMGLALSVLREPATAGAADQARAEALDALRGAFIAGAAPRIEDVIRRIEDALAVFKARLSGAAGAIATHRDDEPSWRRAPEGPRFVETNFMAAPNFAAAGEAGTRAGSFFSGKARADAAPKQCARGVENPPWLKD